ncbi:MAG: hypothetical protein ACM3NR_02305 [Methanosarcina sp.]
MKSKLFIVNLLIILLLTSCAIKKNFLLSPVVPAARGNVRIETDKNKNYTIKVRIYNLAEAERVTAHESTYVVWMETADQEIRNIGQIKSTKKFMSKSMVATLETKSAYKPVKIFLTAEENSGAKTPDDQIVLSTERF